MADPPFKLDEPTARLVPPFTGLTAAARLTMPQIPIFAERATTNLMRLADAHRLALTGDPVFIYSGAGTGPHDLFTMQIALPVPDDAADQIQPTDDHAVKHFDAFKCFAVGYRGPMTHIGDAYAPVMNALRDAGHTPLEQSREVYRRWVAYDSPENHVEIQLGIA